MKTCNKCKIEKDESEFYKRKLSNDGLHAHCKVCNKEIVALWQRNNPERRAEHNQKSRFGLANGRKAEIIAEQDNKCDMCGDEFTKTPHTDHNHATKFVRGQLCFGCNIIIGIAKDQRERLLQGVAYLDKWNEIEENNT